MSGDEGRRTAPGSGDGGRRTAPGSGDISVASGRGDKGAAGSGAATRRILGIDPGTRVMGYALLDVRGGEATAVLAGAVTMPPASDPHQRLHRVAERMEWLLGEYHPTEMAIEAPFLGLNARTLLTLARAQGVCLAAALRAGLTVAEYAPSRVKQAITGHGDASKQQVADMLHRLVDIERNPRYLDATDALAIAYAHHQSTAAQALRSLADEQHAAVALPAAGGKKGSWADFAREHPERVRQ